MGDIVNGDKIVFGNNSRMIKIEMKNYFGTDSNKDESTPDSGFVETEDTEFEEVRETTVSPASADTGELPSEINNDDKGFIPDAKAIEKCFKFNSDFVKQSVVTLVSDFYQGNYANLALIEITLFHHQQLKRRNSHKSFVMALAAWGIITIANDEEFKLTVMGVSDKYKRMPMEGYLEWDDDYKTDRQTCERMGKKLDPSIKYME